MDLKKLKQLAGLAERDHSGVDVKGKITVESLQGVTEVNRMRSLAGLPLLVEWADDDDMSSSERALADMADRDLKKKGIKVDADPEKDLEKLAKSKAAKKAASKEEHDASQEEKDEKAAQAAEKAKASAEHSAREKAVAAEKDDEPAANSAAKPTETVAEKKARAQKGSVTADMNKWIAGHKEPLRSAAMAHGKSLGHNGGSVSAWWIKHQPRSQFKDANEVYVFTHPSVPSFQLVENTEMGIYQWVDYNSNLEPMVFTDLNEAKKVARHLGDWKNQFVNITPLCLRESDSSSEYDDWVKKVKEQGAVKFTNTDNKTIAYDKDGKRVGIFE